MATPSKVSGGFGLLLFPFSTPLPARSGAGNGVEKGPREAGALRKEGVEGK